MVCEGNKPTPYWLGLPCRVHPRSDNCHEPTSAFLNRQQLNSLTDVHSAGRIEKSYRLKKLLEWSATIFTPLPFLFTFSHVHRHQSVAGDTAERFDHARIQHRVRCMWGYSDIQAAGMSISVLELLDKFTCPASSLHKTLGSSQELPQEQ